MLYLCAAVGAVVAVSGHPFLSIVAAMAAGVLSGFCNCNPADKTRCGQSACRNYCKYCVVFRKYCSHGRLVPDQYEPYNDGIQYDERYTFRNSVKRQRRYHHCGNRCDPRNLVSCIFPENKTRSLQSEQQENNSDMVKSSSITRYLQQSLVCVWPMRLPHFPDAFCLSHRNP